MFTTCAVLGFSGEAFAASDFLGTPESRAKNIPGNFQSCDNGDVKKFIGKDRKSVLSEVRKMNLRTLRVLDLTAPVNYEFVPDRLTLVISDQGVVTRSFCR
ncbi:MAG: hypothetical protein ORN98_01675 [Alphaproteobacteria bacterium]|nr:hypothetical protein [Alphaproteobacteria bacterium]